MGQKISLEGKRILGIDYGSQVIGLATYQFANDPYPLPFDRIIVKNQKQVLQELRSVVADECIDMIVLGLPLYTDGKESQMTQTVRQFGELLKSSFNTIELFYQDETLTSFEAQERMKSSPRYDFKVDPKQIDALAASIIIEDFIKANNS